VQTLFIDSDSVLYHYGYSTTKHRGLSKYKLNPVEFAKIQDKLHYIDWNNIEIERPVPSGGYFSLFIKTPNDSIEIILGGNSDNIDFINFIRYLVFLERFLNLNPIEDEEVSFRYDMWSRLK